MDHLIKDLPEIIEHSVLDTLKILPFLFLTYLFMEFLEHKAGGAPERWLRRSGKVGPLVGSLLGALPQCGFSTAAAGLYTGRIITKGTLVAVWLSTSDEMLPILISEGAPFTFILKVIFFKVIIGLAAGFAIDLIAKGMRKQQEEPQIEELCERDRCRCGEHFVISALRHTAKITLFVLLFTLLLNLVIHGSGEDKIASFVLDRPVLSNLLASLVGLIPNCASSIALTKLYLDGVISIGSMLSGLLVNAGVGVLILLRNNRPLLDSLRIIAILFSVGALVGIITDLSPIALLF